MGPERVTVVRRVERDGVVIEETATASLADDLTLDDLTESLRRGTLARALFRALPSVQADLERELQAKRALN